MSAQDATAARTRHLETLHAVVSAALAALYNDALRPGFEAEELGRALDAENAASKAVTRAVNAEAQRTSQPALEGVAFGAQLLAATGE